MNDRILIEEYRGFDIYFDKRTEEFNAISNEYDIQKNKKSLGLAKNSIDDYIKDNLDFKSVVVQMVGTMFASEKEIELIGIRKDGRFVFRNKKGEPEQLSEYSERDYFLKNETNSQIFKDIDLLRIKIKDLEKEIRVKESQVVKDDLGLKNLKSKYIK